MRIVHEFLIGFDWHQALSAFLVLFAVIDVLGSTAIVINLRKKAGYIHAPKAIVAVGMIMISFLFVGQSLLDLFYVDAASFSVAGSIILCLIGLEMILDVSIFKIDIDNTSSSVVPLAFPIIVGPGTLTTLITLRSEYADINILCGTLANFVFIYAILRYSEWIECKLGSLGVSVTHKVMGIILLSVAVKLFRTHLLSAV